MIVYAITDPRRAGKPIFYVGATRRQPLAKRIRQHMREARHGSNDAPNYQAMRSILASGAAPGFAVLGIYLSHESMRAGEKMWISRLRARGFELTNCTEGGDAVFGYQHSEERKRKISTTHKGKRTWMFGRKHRPETKAKMAAARKARWADPEYRRKQAGQRPKQSAAAKAMWADPEYRRKQSEATQRRTEEEAAI